MDIERDLLRQTSEDPCPICGVRVLLVDLGDDVELVCPCARVSALG